MLTVIASILILVGTVFAFYFLLDWPNITTRIKKIIPPRRRGNPQYQIPQSPISLLLAHHRPFVFPAQRHHPELRAAVSLAIVEMVRQPLFAVLLEDQCADRHGDLEVVPRLPGAVGALPMLAAPGLELGMEAVGAVAAGAEG